MINDWLFHEFRDRLKTHRKVILTTKLSNDFKLSNISITNKEVEKENQFIGKLNEENLQ